MKIFGAAVLAVLAAAPAGAQDQDLGPLLFVKPSNTAPESITSASAIQLYRVPLDYTIRSMDDHRWGITLTCPISISSVRVHLQAVQEAARLAHSLGVFAV